MEGSDSSKRFPIAWKSPSRSGSLKRRCDGFCGIYPAWTVAQNHRGLSYGVAESAAPYH